MAVGTGNGDEPDRKKPKREKIYLVLLILALLVILGLVIAFIILFLLNTTDKTGVCMNIECVKAAANLYDSIDFTVDPCDNFYDYACGKWERKQVIPEDRSYISATDLVREDVAVLVRGLLDGEDGNDIEAVRKARVLYKSCLNETWIEERNTSVVFSVFKTIGSWPVVTPTWNINAFSLRDTLVSMRKLGSWPIISMYVSTDSKNGSKRIIYMDQPNLGMPSRDYLLKGKDDTMVRAYVKLVQNFAIELGADPKTAARDIDDMLEFEIKIAKIMTPRNERRDPDLLYNVMTIRDLQRNFSGYDWYGYMRDYFRSEHVGILITVGEKVIVRDPSYFKQLMPILKRTSKRVISNYVIWRFLWHKGSYLPQRFIDHITDYKKVVSGSVSPPVRWKKCTHFAKWNMGLAVGRLFIDRYFNKEAKDSIEYLIRYLKDAMKELVDELDWMDDATKPLAIEKADAMDQKIGYTHNPDILDDNELNDLYVNRSFREDTYFENYLENLKWGEIDRARNLRKDVDKTRWTTSPTTVNAYYSFSANTIYFPAGILQPPFYHKNVPMSLNFGGIGAVIGHEITHGFDDGGRKYDKDGNLRQWWNNDVIEAFKERAQCIVDQFENFRSPEADMNLNGVTTQGENIADSGGLKQAFRAYRNWVKENGEEQQTLPVLNLTHNQLFFVNFAQTWCSKYRKQRIISDILSGQHSPGGFRVIGSTQNSKDFAEAFNCKEGTYMNPENRCSVW